MMIRSMATLTMLLGWTSLALADHQMEKGAKGGKAGKEGHDMQAMMAAMEKASTPGDQHKALLRRVGKWNVVVKHSMPGQPAMETKGTAETKSILGDRFVQTAFTGSFMDKPFNGFGTVGYDNISKKIVGTWIDTMSTGIMRSEGTPDASGKTVTSNAVSSDPMTGKICKSRIVEKWESDDKVVEEYFQKKGAKESKMMEIVYTRAGK